MRWMLQFGVAAAFMAALLGRSAFSAQKAAPKQTTKKSTPKKSTAKKSAPKTATAKKTAPKATAKSATEYVEHALEAGLALPVENPAGLVPFFEQLYRHQHGELPGPVRVLQYGDSHTAADEFSGELRMLFQSSFGNGGSGFSIAGKPFQSYRRRDVKSGSSNGWHTDGLVTRTGDGIYGLGGLSMTATAPRESVFLETEASDFELYYYQQPGGGAVRLYDSGVAFDMFSTAGDPGPAYYRVAAQPGPHRFEVETLEPQPVRLFGWVAENATGITYETFGINGAQATIAAQWDPTTLRDNIAHRNPDLIVLAYGTNEAGMAKWTLDAYQEMFTGILRAFREASPTASILVLGPPDRAQRVRRQWQTMARIGIIAEAQRRAAFSMGCAFLDLREEMGGSGSMLQWVKAGQAQADHVHFTAPGYRKLGNAVFGDIMNQYAAFLKARNSIMAASSPGHK